MDKVTRDMCVAQLKRHHKKNNIRITMKRKVENYMCEYEVKRYLGNETCGEIIARFTSSNPNDAKKVIRKDTAHLVKAFSKAWTKQYGYVVYRRPLPAPWCVEYEQKPDGSAV